VVNKSYPVPREKSASSPVATRLREARTQAGLSQKQLGIRVGMDLSVASPRVNQYERGTHEPKFNIVKKFATALSVPAAYFYADDPSLAELIAKYGRLKLQERKRLLRQLK